MDKTVDYLKQLGLTDIEAKLYLALLKSGPTGVKELAQKVDVKRTTAYFYIDQLIEKNLIIKLVKGSKKQITVVDPQENLERLVQQKMLSAKQTKELFPTMLKTITTLGKDIEGSQEAEIKYYKGKLGVKKIYEEALQSKELRTYVKVEATDGLFSDNISLFNNAFKKNPHLSVKELIYDSPSATKDAHQILLKSKRYSYKLIPNELKLTSGDILIYDGKVAIITYKGVVTCVVLKSIDYYNNSKELFDYIWRTIT